MKPRWIPAAGRPGPGQLDDRINPHRHGTGVVCPRQGYGNSGEGDGSGGRTDRGVRVRHDRDSAGGGAYTGTMTVQLGTLLVHAPMRMTVEQSGSQVTVSGSVEYQGYMWGFPPAMSGTVGRHRRVHGRGGRWRHGGGVLADDIQQPVRDDRRRVVHSHVLGK